MGRPRKYSLDENYFEDIDSNDKAYVLGFIYADGSVYKTYLSIWLAIKDVAILDYIKGKLNYGGIIYNYYDKKKDKKYVGLTVSSKKIVSDLNKLGVINNKTYLSKTLPIYDEKYEKAFLRGFFDGDGSIYSSNSRKYIEYTVNFSGNKSVLTQLKGILNKYGVTSCKVRHRHSNDESCMLDIRGSKNIEKINNLFYDDYTFSLKRKKNRFNDFMLMLNTLTRRNLSDKIINEIKFLYISGIKQFNIANKMNIPKSSVRTVIQRLRKNEEIK